MLIICPYSFPLPVRFSSGNGQRGSRCQHFSQLCEFFKVLHNINPSFPEHFHKNAIISLIQPHIWWHRRAKAIVRHIQHLAPGSCTFNHWAVSSGSLETDELKFKSNRTVYCVNIVHLNMRGVGRIQESYANLRRTASVEQVMGLHNWREFSQSPQCLDEAV